MHATLAASGAKSDFAGRSAGEEILEGTASVALAAAGDSTHRHDFVNRRTDDHAEVANLNYWAGELSDKQVGDDFMLDADARSWTGVRLLRHLVNRLSPESPHPPLNLCTLHSLVASRPSLLAGPPEIRISLAGVPEKPVVRKA
jgi:hypothetical protein